MALNKIKESANRKSTRGSAESLEAQVNSVEDILGEIKPAYDYDIISFETAEAYADSGGRFAFSMFPDAPSRSQQYDEAAVKSMAAALEKVR
jgi:hypothetical protein